MGGNHLLEDCELSLNFKLKLSHFLFELSITNSAPNDVQRAGSSQGFSEILKFVRIKAPGALHKLQKLTALMKLQETNKLPFNSQVSRGLYNVHTAYQYRKGRADSFDEACSQFCLWPCVGEADCLEGVEERVVVKVVQLLAGVVLQLSSLLCVGKLYLMMCVVNDVTNLWYLDASAVCIAD